MPAAEQNSQCSLLVVAAWLPRPLSSGQERLLDGLEAGDVERTDVGAVVGGATGDDLDALGLADLERSTGRASFHADSTASPPPVVRNTRFRSPGASAASRSASSMAVGCA